MAHIRPLNASLALSVIALSVVAPGCGGSSKSDPGTALTDVPSKLAPAYCAVIAQCIGEVQSLYNPGFDCLGTTTKSLAQGDLSVLQSYIDGGNVHYDGTLVDSCADAVRQAGCKVFSTRLATLCAGLTTGAVESGSPCSISAECKTGLFCKTDSACPGSCTPLLTAGQDATDSDECQDGLLLSDDTQKCVKPAALGETCRGGGPPCSPELVCQGGTATVAGTCIASSALLAGASGASCDPTQLKFCQSSLGCALVGVAAGAAQFQCEAPSSVASGGCHVAYPEACPSGQYCELPIGTVTGTCKPLPGNGAACAKHVPSDAKSADKLCLAGTVCDPTTTLCHAVQDLGGACSTGQDNECFSGTCSNGGCAPTKCSAH